MKRKRHSLILKLIEENPIATQEELLEYLSGYSGEMVSHSEIYRKAYSPAYRVVLEKLAENLQ